MEKLNVLKDYINGLGKLCIGFSGGVDSTFLLKAAHECLGENVLAVLADGPMMARRDFRDAVRIVEEIGAKYVVLPVNPLELAELEYNDKKRCYYCKKSIFSRITAIAKEHGFDKVADGKNTDDAKVYRPGAQACEELGVVSPLYDCGFSKADIREGSRVYGLETAEKPSNSCLFTRIPYGEQVTKEKLTAIEQAEDILRDRGLTVARVRLHGDLARIEVAKENLPEILAMADLTAQFKNLGFRYTTLDLEGFRSGSMD